MAVCAGDHSVSAGDVFVTGDEGAAREGEAEGGDDCCELDGIELVPISLHDISRSSSLLSEEPVIEWKQRKHFSNGLPSGKRKRLVTLNSEHSLWKRALAKMDSLGDVWKNFDVDGIETECAVRHRYNALTSEWTSDTVLVKMEQNHFNCGAMRRCFRTKKLSNFSHKDDWRRESNNFVAKSYIDAVERQVYFQDVQLQMEAKLWGEEYNRHTPPKKVDIMQMCVVEMVDRPSCPLFHLEHFIEGDYVKYNSNSGFVRDENMRLTPQAFSHFTFERSGHQLIVVDVQGVGDLYTDPQIHTADGESYGDGNLGTRGMALFFHSHVCSSICEGLGLTRFDLAPTESRLLASFARQQFNCETVLRESGSSSPTDVTAAVDVTSDVTLPPDARLRHISSPLFRAAPHLPAHVTERQRRRCVSTDGDHSCSTDKPGLQSNCQSLCSGESANGADSALTRSRFFSSSSVDSTDSFLVAARARFVELAASRKLPTDVDSEERRMTLATGTLAVSPATYSPGHVTDSPGHVTDSPGHVTDSPGHVTDSPGHVTDSPSHVTDSPGLVTDSAGHVTDSPGHVTNSPGLVSESPGHITDSPGHVTDSPRHITDSPGHVTDSPRHITDSPGHVTDSPGHVTDSPGHVTDSPGHVTDSPGHVTDSPGNVTDSPGNVTDSPGHVTYSPGHVTDSPGHVTDSPGHVSDSPGHVTDSPGHVTDSPGHVTDSPDHVADSPGHVTDSPGHVTDSPGHVTDSPGHVTDSAMAHSVLGEIHFDLVKYHEVGRFRDVSGSIGDQCDAPEYDHGAACFHLWCAVRCCHLPAVVLLSDLCSDRGRDLLTDVKREEVLAAGCDAQLVAGQLLLKAALLGDRTSMLALARQYQLGDPCVRQDWTTALHWFERALCVDADDSEGAADYELIAACADMCWQGGPGLQADPARAAEMYNRAAEMAMMAMKGRLASRYFTRAEQCLAECCQ